MKLLKISTKIIKFVIFFLTIDIIIFFLIPESIKLSIYNKRSHKLQSYYYHHDQRSNANYLDHWGNSRPIIYSNKYGFKDKQKGLVKFSDKNILFIGDSLVEGVGLKYEDTWVGIVAEQLKERNIVVLNAGLQTYASSIYLAKTYDLIERKKLPITDVYVMISVNDISDDFYRYKSVDENFKVRHDEEVNILSIEIMNFIKGNTFTYQIIAELTPPLAFIQKLRSSFSAIKNSFSTHEKTLLQNQAIKKNIQSEESILIISNGSDYKLMYDENIFEKNGKESILKTINYLNRLGVYLSSKKINLTILLPRESVFIIKNPIDKNYEFLINQLESLNKNNIKFIYLNEYYQENTNRFDAYRDLFFANDVHWNKKGNLKIAEEILSKAF
jgi:lysophospholipase L1-like esterase